MAKSLTLCIDTFAGILSFFAIQAGARKVYSIEGSDMASFCQDLVKANGAGDKMVVVKGKVEEVCSESKLTYSILSA